MFKETVKYNDAPAEVEKSFNRSVVVTDFLPDPDTLTSMSKKERITIALDKATLNFFRQEAKKQDTHYQTMINKLLGSYVASQTMPGDSL